MLDRQGQAEQRSAEAEAEAEAEADAQAQQELPTHDARTHCHQSFPSRSARRTLGDVWEQWQWQRQRLAVAAKLVLAAANGVHNQLPTCVRVQPQHDADRPSSNWPPELPGRPLGPARLVSSKCSSSIDACRGRSATGPHQPPQHPVCGTGRSSEMMMLHGRAAQCATPPSTPITALTRPSPRSHAPSIARSAGPFPSVAWHPSHLPTQVKTRVLSDPAPDVFESSPWPCLPSSMLALQFMRESYLFLPPQRPHDYAWLTRRPALLCSDILGTLIPEAHMHDKPGRTFKHGQRQPQVLVHGSMGAVAAQSVLGGTTAAARCVSVEYTSHSTSLASCKKPNKALVDESSHSPGHAGLSTLFDPTAQLMNLVYYVRLAGRSTFQGHIRRGAEPLTEGVSPNNEAYHSQMSLGEGQSPIWPSLRPLNLIGLWLAQTCTEERKGIKHSSMLAFTKRGSTYVFDFSLSSWPSRAIVVQRSAGFQQINAACVISGTAVFNVRDDHGGRYRRNGLWHLEKKQLGSSSRQ
ncbi:hypothetical protein AC579_9423 [Pseudocercospora musae]|uniref:Uncharacterized protein n=1 Tax=Pseudocercospora musae TaxID=113226 RepID=A0A139I1R3_9PEZI|nr:hypothetical protein AC579_9423 [Pseudocercospora musae]